MNVFSSYIQLPYMEEVENWEYDEGEGEREHL